MSDDNPFHATPPAEYTFYAYQQAVRATAIYPDTVRIVDERGEVVSLYPLFGLAGEVGELQEKVKKIIRDNSGIMSEQQRTLLALELGDVLWYIASFTHELGYRFATIARLNEAKLRSRAERNKLRGSGDNC